MPNVRANFAEKWARVTPQRTEDYAIGIRNPKRDWEEATTEAAPIWAEGITKAIQNKSFDKGVKKAGSAKWLRKSEEVGAARFGPGVQAAVDDYRTGFEPFKAVIEATKLPPRFAKGDPRNIERVRVIAEALRKKKLQG